MKRICVLAAVLALLCMVGGPAFAGWTVTSLHPAGASSSCGRAISGGQAVGWAVVEGQQHASLWTGTAASWVDLNPAGAIRSHAYGVSGGQQVGDADMPYARCASVWDGSAGSWTNLTPAGTNEAGIHGIDGQQRVGYVKVPSGYTYVYRAALWNGGSSAWTDLGVGFANAVCDGQQVGNRGMSNSPAALWSGSAEGWVNLTPAGATYSMAWGVSGGQQVGQAMIGSYYHASLWTGSAASWVDLHPAGAAESYAYGVSGGRQVGDIRGTRETHAALWSGSAGSSVDLHAFLPSSTYRMYSSARGIYSSGDEIWVVGMATNVVLGRDEAMLWHYDGVIPEPSSLIALGSGLLVLAGLIRRRR